MTLYQIFRAGSLFLYIVRIAILAHVVLSWLRLRGDAFTWLENFVRPFISPFRRFSVWLMARTSIPLDFSSWFALIGLSIVERVWWWVYRLLR